MAYRFLVGFEIFKLDNFCIKQFFIRFNNLKVISSVPVNHPVYMLV